MQHDETIRQLIDRVRRRWRLLRAYRAAVRAALAAVAAIGAGVLAARWMTDAPLLLGVTVAAALAIAGAAIVRALWPLRRSPDASRVARFIEERAPDLDDRLASAVDVVNGSTRVPAALAGPMLADAARRAREIDLDAIVPDETLRRAGFQAAAATLALAALLILARTTIRQGTDALALTVFPSRVTLDVAPGHARLKAGTPLVIHARLVGNRAPVIAQLQIADGDRWRASDMTVDRGAFSLSLPPVSASFKYRVAAGAVSSPTFDVAVVHPPRVARIDVDYTYPAGLRLPPRTEKDGGDIYAPAGTQVCIHVVPDRAAAAGRLSLAGGAELPLAAQPSGEFVADLTVAADTSYRVALADREGMTNPGETEYFIRPLEDRPPEVRIVKPATDRQVTRLEEVDVEAHAEDDYGIDRFDLVYSVRGGAEQVVPLAIRHGAPAADARQTIFLEDLDVQAGDMVAYYVRARDVTRGTRPHEARSDIFFLEVKPYEQEFRLAQSQGGMSGAGRGSLDDLVVAQKEVIVATWKLERRAQANGAKSEQDIRSVSRAEAELKTRVEQTASSFRESTMRDPRRPSGRRGGPPPLRAGETMAEEDDMTAAATAMGRAVTTLEALQTDAALPPEMDALNHLLKAQADVKKREIQQQQQAGGAGNTNRNLDLSSLFDRELQKAQQTNYETRSSAEQREDPNQSAIDRIKDLARRQDELIRKQQELARDRAKMTEEELRRALERLTREQAELKQRAEELSRQMASQPPQDGQPARPDGRGSRSGDPQSGQQDARGQQGQSGGGGGASQRMRQAAEQMANATGDLRRQDAGQATASASRALQSLQEAQRQLESARPDERRRAVGEMRLEARQLADAERQIASELGKTAAGEAGKDAVRRLAGEQERLADRARRLQESLKQQGAAPALPPRTQTGRGGSPDAQTTAQTQAAAADAAKDLERQRVAERMQQAADAIRAAADAKTPRGNTAPADASAAARAQAGPGRDLAQQLDRIADKLSSPAGGREAESQKLSEQLARAQELKDRLAETGRQLQNAASQNGSTRTPGDRGRAGQGRQGGGGGSSVDVTQLREEYARQLQETQALVDQLRRDDPAFTRGGGAGFTFDDPTRMVLSAPGTEAFKQDFAKWEDLRRQATQALDRVETAVSKKLQAKQAKDRLSAGVDDKAPTEYQKQVDSYFKAIATRKKP